MDNLQKAAVKGVMEKLAEYKVDTKMTPLFYKLCMALNDQLREIVEGPGENHAK